MRLKQLTPEQLVKDKEILEHILEKLLCTKVGRFAFDETTHEVFDDTAEEREARLEEFYQDGDYKVFFSGYIDILHPFAGKRPLLEQDYYEMMNKSRVTLVDVKSNPVTHLVSNGIVTTDGTIHEADIIFLATGFDTVTCGFKDIDITGLNGLTLQERWSDGIRSYLRMSIAGFPNFFYIYGPFSPSAYVNGPVVVESQVDWIVSVLRKMQAERHTRIEATQQAESEWREKVFSIHAMTLRENIEGGWYLGYVQPFSIPINSHTLNRTILLVDVEPSYSGHRWLQLPIPEDYADFSAIFHGSKVMSRLTAFSD